MHEGVLTNQDLFALFIFGGLDYVHFRHGFHTMFYNETPDVSKNTLGVVSVLWSATLGFLVLFSFQFGFSVRLRFMLFCFLLCFFGDFSVISSLAFLSLCCGCILSFIV